MARSTATESAAQAAAELPESGQPSPTATPPVPEELLDTVDTGLERIPQRPKRVIVIGAGAAGLVAAFELRRQGHKVTLLEAQNRVGGRIYTMRKFAPGLYAEAGAMRIPAVHSLTHAYCDRFGLERRPFVMDNNKCLLHLSGKTLTYEEAELHPERLPFPLAPNEQGKTWSEMWNEATKDVTALYDKEGQSGWDKISATYDNHSLREFLEEKGFSEGAIEMYGLLSFREQNMNVAVVEQFFEIVGRAFEDMSEIVGGCDRLTDAFYDEVQDSVRFGAEVTAIEQDEDLVTVHYRNRSGRHSVVGEFAICTLPFTVLSNIEVMPSMSREKRQAIRELRYNASTKILLQVRRRFWETEPDGLVGILGGTTGTDLPIRRIVYPSFADPTTERGVLLGSYTWGQDALRWGSLPESDRIEQALEDVAKIHPQITQEFELGASHAWFSDPHAGGAFAQFEPGQMTRLQHAIVRPEGRIHFAGEHCSLYHAWIQGALESGLRAADEVHKADLPEHTEAAA